MNVALIGASGNVGSRIVTELLGRRYTVSGIVRHPEKLTAREGLTLKKGDIKGESGLTDANGESKISMEDYAIAMVDELETPKHPRVRFTVGY